MKILFRLLGLALLPFIAACARAPEKVAETAHPDPLLLISIDGYRYDYLDRGLSPTAAGLMMSGSVMVQLFSALGAPWLGTRGRDQRLVVFLVLALTLAGLLGLLYAPSGSLWLWAVVLGLGQGGTFSIGLALIVLRSPDAHVASHLSGMAQGVGYTLAALGPFLVGLVHDLSDGWNAVGVIFIAISLGALVAGLGAGRDRLVGVRSEALP